MPDQLTSNGLQIKTLPEIRTEMETALREIYGEDINVDPNSPDGQLINIFAQASIDSRELLKKVYDSFDVFQAQGRVLDQRVTLGGIKRKGASFNFAVVEVEVDREVQLQGLDGRIGELSPSVPNLFTVKDAAGTKYYLRRSTLLDAPQPATAPTSAPSPSAAESSAAFEQWKNEKRAAQVEYDKKVAEYTRDVNAIVSVPGWLKKSEEELKERDKLPVEEQAAYPLSYQLPPPIPVPEILYETPQEFREKEASPAASPTDSAVSVAPQKVTKTHSLLFRAAPIGKVETLANTITESVTIIAGVTSVSNRNKAPIEGVDEETDAQLKRRFARSFSLPAQGYLEGIQSQIEALSGIDQAKVYENDTPRASDTTGQTPHSIWVIVRGTRAKGDNEDSTPVEALPSTTRRDITEILYRSKPAGTGMYAVEDPESSFFEDKLLRPNGQYFKAKWNEAVERELDLKMSIILRKSEGGDTDLTLQDIENLKSSFVGADGEEKLQWALGVSAGIDDVYSFLNRKHPKYRVTQVEFIEGDSSLSRVLHPRPNEILVLNQEKITINE